MLDDLAELERALDRLIVRLSKAGGAKQTNALLLEARRLRTAVATWRTIAPTPAALREMGQRIERLLRAVDEAAPQDRSSATPPDKPHESPPDRASPPVAAQTAPRYEPIVTEPPPAPMMRGRTLPELDISGVAQLTGDSAGLGFEQEAALRPGQGSSASGSAKRRSDLTSAAEERSRPTRPVRPSRLLDDPDFEDGAGPIYGDEAAQRRSSAGPGARGSSVPGVARRDDRDSSVPAARRSERESSAPPVARRSERESSSPPVVRRSDKTPIAVRPLPAPESPDGRLVMLIEPFSERADAYRALRRKLSGPGSPKTIAVTSAQPGEGKTTCAVNLALAFRETSSEKVLLVEANMRAPSFAKLFGFEPPVCFAKQMAKNREMDRATWTVTEQYEPLHVLAVDPATKAPPVLDPVAFANALGQLVEAGYDHIIVDAPPAIGGSDANIIADAVDGIVVVAWIKKSKVSLVKKAITQLKPATILGVVTLED